VAWIHKRFVLATDHRGDNAERHGAAIKQDDVSLALVEELAQLVLLLLDILHQKSQVPYL
jgi:hypothetical protein